MSAEKTITIMMIGGAKRVSMAEQLIKSGNKLGYNVRIISSELDSHLPIASVGEIVIGKRCNDPGVVENITELVARYNVDIILPFIDNAIAVVAKCKEFLPNTYIPISPISTAEIMFDKAIAAHEFEKAELAIPTTYSIHNIKYPAIAKPRTGSASKGIVVINNDDELAKLDNIDNYLIQEYISNREEYTVDCYISAEGEILTIVPRLRIEVSGGEVTRTRTCKIERLIEMSRQVIEAFEMRGPITIQFLHDLDTDRFLLMEINPRLGGGVICSISAGAPIADYIIAESLGLKVEPYDEWKDATLMTRYPKEVIFYEK